MYLLLLWVLVILPRSLCRYSPTWDSLDTRPTPDWYDKAKIGVFMHCGPYSVPGVVSEWFWFYWKRNNKSLASMPNDKSNELFFFMTIIFS